MGKWPVVIVTVLAVLASGSGQEQPLCTVTVQPGQSIQEAIDSAPEGAVICVSADNLPYWENLTIMKSLTLRGAGRDKTFLMGQDRNQPAISIGSSTQLEVVLEDLTESWGPSEYPPLTIGVEAWGEAKVTLRNVEIRRNSYSIVVRNSAQVQLENSIVHTNRWGAIFARDSAQVLITDSHIYSGWASAVVALGSALVNITNSVLSDSQYGLVVGDFATVEVLGSHFLDNGSCGIYILSTTARVLGPPQEFQGNGADLCGFAPISLRKPLIPQTDRLHLQVPENFSDLQEAIDAVAPGGTITVSPGIYEVGLTFWKPVTVRGAGREQTILKARPTRLLIGSITAEGVRVKIESVAITDSAASGLLIYGQADLFQVQVSDNQQDGGLLIGGAAVVEVRDSLITRNGFFPECSRNADLCNGITVGDQAQLKLIDSVITGNGDWGVSVTLKQCGYGVDGFTGQVIFEGTNIIEDNNKWGNQKGMGNPGNHPFQHLPDGQVCLP